MELSKELPIFDLATRYADQINEDQKLEITFYTNAKYTETEFNNFTNVFNSLGYSEVIEKECLVVSSGNTELSIVGMPNIIRYCHNESHDQSSPCFKKNIIMTDSIEDTFDDSVKFSLCSYVKSTVPDTWDDLSKRYRINKKIKYSKKDIDFVANIYKTSDDEHYSMKRSNILKNEQMYEFQIILSKANASDIVNAIVVMMRAFHMSNMLLTKMQQKQVLEDYHNMVKNDVVVSGYNKKSGDIHLIAPKPVTLEQMNMVDPKTYGAVSILSEYTVTEKADGERILMYANESGDIYLINNTLMVEATGLKVSSAFYNSLIDGEFIKCDRRIDNSNRGLYAAFDAYYVGGNRITSLPLIGENVCRYLHLQQFAKNITGGEIDFIVKEHRYSDNILKDSKNILSNAKLFPYEIDGLVFTPAKLALYSYYTNRPVPITDNVKWDRVFKWKPEDQNTIDFLVKFGKTLTKNGIQYREVKLFVGYNASQWEDHTIENVMKIRYGKSHTHEASSYVAVLFKPQSYYEPGIETSHIKINSGNIIRTETGEKIEDSSIVEFRYNNDKNIKPSERWVPIRIRDDKTRIYRKGTLSKTANDFGVALNIWRSIHNPVTTSMIMGETDINVNANGNSDGDINDLVSDDIYYSRNISRDNLLSIHMLNFHNQGIKRNLYKNIPRKKGSLLELCCGDGGDMNRWIDSGYEFIFGIDFVKHNIYNPVSGAYSRMLRRRRQFMRNREQNGAYFPNIAFAAGDCSAPIRTGESASVINDKDSERLMKSIMNRNNTYEPHMKHIVGKGAKGFDVVSCMFAIHYFFANEEKLEGFLRNVSENLKEGGVFFCTFMNGERVHNEIMKNGGSKVEGIKLKSDNYDGLPVWAIIKRYSDNNSSAYGKKIDVFIENTKKLIPEFVVSFETLVEKAKGFGLVLDQTEMFKETFDKLKMQEPDTNDAKRLHVDIMELDKDPVQKQFSFLNQWAVFKKL